MIKRKCEICGFEYKDNETIEEILVNKEQECPNCISINNFLKIVSKFDEEEKCKVLKHEIYNKNMILSTNAYPDGVTAYYLDKHKEYFKIENRSKAINELIERLDEIRKMLVIDIEPRFDILNSIYIKKDLIWNHTGNLPYYISDTIVQYIVIKLKELIYNDDCKYSFRKIFNIIINNKNNIYNTQNIYVCYYFENSKDLLKVKRECFPILDYQEELEKIFENFNQVIKAIVDVRDNHCAHIAKVKDEHSFEHITIENLYKIFNVIKNLYDCILFSISPDKCTTLVVHNSIYIDYLNEIIKNSLGG